MNILETKVSFFTHFKDTTSPTEGTFLQIVSSAKLASKYAPLIERIRATTDKDERTRLKAQLPCFTPSGTFSRRAADGLIFHSGLMQFDIDPKENPLLNLKTAAYFRVQISNLPQVAYCALSASGAGVWGVVPIAHPDQHRAHFEALKADFAGWGIAIDTACSNVDRLRFWSYDPEAFFNPEAILYTKLVSTTAEIYTPRQRPTIATDNAAKVEAVLGQIEATRTDITSGGNGYEAWFAIGCALANEFGEGGRDFFHRASQYYPKYNNQETEGQFSNCLRKSGNGYTLGTFFDIARRYGIEYKKNVSYQSPKVAYPTPSVLPPGYRRERFTARETGLPIEVLLNREGYPAAWDLKPEQRESLSKMIRAKPEITELITRFDLRVGSM
jgi:hypothetical protein